MRKRQLGKSGIEVGTLALGGNVFGWTIDESTSFKILDAYTESGLNLIDTADVYSRWVPGNQGGESETIIGRWLKKSGKRDRVVIATKVGMEMGEGKKGLSRKRIEAAVEESLRRLQVETIDLYQSHSDDADTPLEETLETYAQLIKSGKVRAIGASNYSADRLSKAIEISRSKNILSYQSLQPHYNLVEREKFEKDLEPLCLKNGIGVISYFSLASGFLTGKYRSEKDLGKSQRGQGAKQYLNEKGLQVLKALDQIAEQTRSTPAQVALAWLMARPSVTAPIASATSLDQLNDLISAARLELQPEMIEKLNQASRWE